MPEARAVEESRPGTAAEDGVSSRRSFLERVGTGWALFTAASATGLIATARFMFPNDLFEPPTRFRIGFPAEYEAAKDGAVNEKWKAKYQIWVVRNLEELYVLSTICTHLGCTPNWLAAERKFKCPCHGSGFYASGINFEGPAPRPLERFKVAIASDGQIEVDKTSKYQFEKGQWKDPNSSLKVKPVG